MKSRIRKNVFIAGHNGMVGSAIIRRLKKNKNIKIITVEKKKLNLKNFQKLKLFLKKNNVNEIYLCASKVGGILENNNKQAEFIYENSLIALNVIHAAYECGVKKLLNFGSSCIFPKNKKKLYERDLLTGKLEPTNEGYAISKILSIKICEKYNLQYGKSHKIDFRSVMPCNLFGPNDNYNPESSHVIPALIRKFVEAKLFNHNKVTVWGSGRARREFLYVDDLADASIKIMSLSKKKYNELIDKSESFINVGSGKEYTIQDLVKIISKIAGYKKKIIFDKKYPDGTMRKVMDSSKVKSIGWKPRYNLNFALKKVIKNILNKSIKNNKFSV